MRLRIIFIVFCLITGNPVFAQNSNSLIQKLKNHTQQDTLRCYLLNEIIEAENDQNIWIKYNQELQKIASGKFENEKKKALKKVYARYLSISYNKEGAFQLYNEAFQLASQMDNLDFIATSHKNYGDIYLKQNQLIQAESHYAKAADLFKKIDSDINYSKVVIKLAMIYFSQDKLEKAKEYGLRGYDLSQKTKYPSDRKNAAEILSRIYSKQNDYKNAFLYKAIASKISEEIYFDESKDIALKATYKYETEKREASIKALHQKNQIAELESKRKSITLYLVILFFAAIISTAYILFSRFKERKKNELLKTQLAEAGKLLEAEKKVTESELKALKSQMNPHFIFNALNSIQMQFMYGDKLVANEQLNNFTYLTRQILEVSGKKQITIAEETEILTKYLELEQLRFSKDFIYTISVCESIDEDYHKIPPMLIQPIVENSLKHGLMHKTGPKKIEIVFEIDEEETFIICKVTDNGIGREKSAGIKAKNQSGHNSFSTKSIEQRLELLNVNLHLEQLIVYSDVLDSEGLIDGTQVLINIPIV